MLGVSFEGSRAEGLIGDFVLEMCFIFIFNKRFVQVPNVVRICCSCCKLPCQTHCSEIITF